MKMLDKRILGILLSIALVLPLSACRINDPQLQTNGIQIEEDAPYTAEVLERAEQTIFSLVLYTYRNAVVDKIPEKVEKRLLDYARRIRDITASHPISKEQYLWAIQLLEQQGEGAINEALSLRKGKSTDCQTMRELYLGLSSVFGADHVASMLYDCCLLIYDVRYERIIERMNTYQHPWYQEEALALTAEKAVFTNSIGREDFSALVQLSTAAAELMSITAEEIPNAFSNAEVLEIIRHLEISKIDIDKDGWKLLLSRISIKEGSSYHAALSDAFTKSGDIDRVADVMNDTLGLLVGVMDRLTSQDIGLLREGKRDALIASVFSRFEDKDWQIFEAVTSVPLSNEQYSALATEEYGKEYSTFLADIQPINVQALRAGVDSPQFCSHLFDYFAAICPAISYEVIE